MPKKRRSYGETVLKVAPAFAAKALLGDLPKGTIEATVESRLAGNKITRASLAKALKGRAAGRAAGGVAGIVTAPLFLKGVGMAGSADKKERAEGLSLLAASTALYGTQKGAFEGFRTARVGGASPAKSLAAGASLGFARSSHKVPASLLMGLSLAEAQKRAKKNKKKGSLSHHMIPALTGAGMGAAARGYEAALQGVMTNKGQLVKALRRALPSAAGGAASGLVGGLVLSGVVDAAKRSLREKK